ncbi:MAG: SRPBCC family protein [Leadbetterella sp.]
MKFLKYTFITIVGLIALALLVAAILPKDYAVSTSTTINKPKSEVYAYLKILENQKQYSEWILSDPKSKITFEGVNGTIGSKQSWNSEESGMAGFQVLNSLTDNTIGMDLKFVKPFEGEAKVLYTVDSIDINSTKIKYDFSSSSSWPMNLLSVTLGKKEIEKAGIKSFQNMKRILEK